jgi:hypothetical protein
MLADIPPANMGLYKCRVVKSALHDITKKCQGSSQTARRVQVAWTSNYDTGGEPYKPANM